MLCLSFGHAMAEAVFRNQEAARLYSNVRACRCRASIDVL